MPARRNRALMARRAPYASRLAGIDRRVRRVRRDQAVREGGIRNLSAVGREGPSLMPVGADLAAGVGGLRCPTRGSFRRPPSAGGRGLTLRAKRLVPRTLDVALDPSRPRGRESDARMPPYSSQLRSNPHGLVWDHGARL